MTSTSITNGNFEDGTYTSVIGAYTNNYVPNGWTPDTSFVEYPSYNGVFAVNPYSGSYALQLGDSDPSLSYINAAVSQTINDVAGTIYTISFYAFLVNATSGNADELVVIGNWDGGGSGSWDAWITSNNDSGATVPNVLPGAYFSYSFSFIGTGSDTITFANLGVGNWYVDDVNIYAGTTPTPTVTLISATTDNGTTNLSVGHVVTITVNTSELVNVTGIPTLQLNDNEVATYQTGTGTSTLTFTYTVHSGDNIADLQVTGLNLPSGATIQDAAGNNLSGAVTADLGIQIDTPSGAETPETPSLTVSSPLSVSPGTSIPMGITASPVDSDDTVSITIKGVPRYETITAGPGETVTHKGATYTITSTTPGASISNLTLTSFYKGKKSAVRTLTVTASDKTSGEAATTRPKRVTVTNPSTLVTNDNTQGVANSLMNTPPTSDVPPHTPPGLDHVVALFIQYTAASFRHENGPLFTNPLSQIVANEGQFLAHPHHG